MGKIVILGGANIDIVGQSEKELLEYDSNPGKIKISFGGVARNIAENCCHLGEQVAFATVFGSDAFAGLLKAGCEAAGMDLSLCKDSARSSSIYLAVLDQRQDMKVAISDMNLLQEVDDAMIDAVLSCCTPEDILVLDTNLAQSVIEAAAERCCCPIVMDPISCAKAVKVKNCLGKLHTFKPNRYEAQLLCGFEINREEDQIKAVKWFLDQGVQEVFISLSEEGTIAGNRHEIVKVTPKKVEAVNATGGGDSFLAALIAYRNLDLMERCRMATCMAISTIQSEDTVDPQISREFLAERRKEIEMEGKRLCTFESMKK